MRAWFGGDGGAVRGRRDTRARGIGGGTRTEGEKEESKVFEVSAPLHVLRERTRTALFFFAQENGKDEGERACRKTTE